MSRIARVSALLLVVSIAAVAQVPPLAVVSGRVTGDGGAPIAGARVRFRDTTGQRFEVTTDADGRYSRSLATGSWDVTAIVAGYLLQSNGGDHCSNEMCPVFSEVFYVQRGEQHTVDFALRRTDPPSGTITGTVLDEATGQPMQFAGVNAFRNDGGGAMYEGVADEAGRYSLRLPEGNYLVFGVGGGVTRPSYVSRSGNVTCTLVCTAGRDFPVTAVTAGETRTLDYRLAPIHVFEMTPRGGPAAGGTTVKITGTAYDGTEKVRLGTTEVTPTAITANEITFVAPPGLGHVAVTVFRPNGYTAPFQPGWTWHDPSRTYVTIAPPAAFPRSGERATTTLSLSRPEPTPTVVTITSPEDYLPRQTVTVPAGATSVPVELRSQRGTFEVTASLPASLGGSSSGFVLAVGPTTITVEPSPVQAPRGTPVTITAMLRDPQPTDTILELSGLPAGAVQGLPEAVLVPAEETRVTFQAVLNQSLGYVYITPPPWVAFRVAAELREIAPAPRQRSVRRR